MILPSPHLDEFSLGYAGRIQRMNYSLSTAMMHNELNQHFPEQLSSQNRKGKMASIKPLALAASMDKYEYLRRHTLVPFTHAFSPSEYHVWPHGHTFNLVPNHPISISPIRRKAQYCQCCSKEQIELMGHCYWKRMHQVPGSTHCLIHNEPLISTDQPDPFLAQPDQCHPNTSRAQINELDRYSTAVRNYELTSELIIRQRHPAFLHELFRALSRKSPRIEQGKLTFQILRDIHDAIYEHFPSKWIAYNAHDFNLFKIFHSSLSNEAPSLAHVRLDTQSLLLIFCSRFMCTNSIMSKIFQQTRFRSESTPRKNNEPLLESLIG